MRKIEDGKKQPDMGKMPMLHEGANMKRFAIASIISCSLALAIAATSEPAASQPATQAAADTQPAVV
jgi:hypothetical protein